MNLTLQRGGRVLVRGLNLEVPRGLFVALAGPSGIGKSTLLESFAGLWPPESGSITFRCNQHCLHSPPAFRGRIGFVFQQLHLARNATVLNSVLSGALPRHSWLKTIVGFPKQERKKALEWIEALDLQGYEHRLVRQLSGGEQQRVALARALMRDPELILADEPVSMLDPSLAERVLSLLRKQAHEEGKTVVCVLHHADFVDRFADAVLTLGTSASHQEGEWSFTQA